MQLMHSDIYYKEIKRSIEEEEEWQEKNVQSVINVLFL